MENVYLVAKFASIWRNTMFLQPIDVTELDPNGILSEELYSKWTVGSIDSIFLNYVCKTKCALHDIERSPRM